MANAWDTCVRGCRKSFPLLRQSFNDWLDDDAPRLGASLAFYTILSFSPLVVLALALVSLLFDRASAEAHLLAEVQSLAGDQGAVAVRALLAGGQHAASGIFATIAGLFTLLFGASGVFNELRAALNTIWEAKPDDGPAFRSFFRNRLFSIGMVISVGFLLLVSLMASAGFTAATKWFAGLLPVPPFLLALADFLFSLAGVAVLFALIFKYVPDTAVAWRDVRVGSVVTALLFTVGKLLLGLYLGKASPGSAYGAAGSLVVLVIWVYYSAQIFFFGAEFTHVYALYQRHVTPVLDKDAPAGV